MYNVERWTGKAWNISLESPFKTYKEVQEHLNKYYWHYTKENPYRIKNNKPKKKVQKYTPKFNFKNWNSDSGMVIINKIIK